MEKIIKETTEKLSKGTITLDEANKILLDLFGISCSNDRTYCSNGRTYPTELKLKWYQELIGAFKNRRY
jgi:hypothetical protein